MIDHKSVTIIIPHFGETKEQEYAFDECYASLRESTPEIRIVVAKNGGACHHPRDVRVVAQGQCKAVNAGAAIIDTEWIMVTNDDMIYENLWWEKLTNDLPDNVLCVSPQLVEPIHGAPTFIEYFCGGAGRDFNKDKFLTFVKSHKGEGLRKGFNLPFLIRRELFNLVEQYDIKMDPWSSNSDSDLEYKIRLAGIQPMQQTNCLVYHFSQTSGTSHPDNHVYWQRNWDYFIAKWGFPRANSPIIWTADFDIPEDQLKYRPWWKGFYEKKMP